MLLYFLPLFCKIDGIHQYQSFLGKKLSKSDKADILVCQHCTEKGCSFDKCIMDLNVTDCKQVRVYIKFIFVYLHIIRKAA